MASVIIKNVLAEHLFEWFYFSVMESCGDGAAVICCCNIEQTANNFVKWWRKTKLPKLTHMLTDEFFHPRDRYIGQSGEHIINFHDNNENFMFCDRIIDLEHGDISFIIEEDCYDIQKSFVITRVKNKEEHQLQEEYDRLLKEVKEAGNWCMHVLEDGTCCCKPTVPKDGDRCKEHAK